VAVFFGGGVWVSLDLEAAAVVVSVEGCRCAGVCLQMLDCCAGALDVHSLLVNSGEDRM